MVEQGRDPDLMLSQDGSPRSLQSWADKLLQDLEHSATLLDQVHGGNAYQSSLENQAAKLADPDLTPSGMILKDMTAGQLSFFEFSMQQSNRHKEYFQGNGLDAETLKMMQQTSTTSLVRQKEIEAAEEINFDEFLERWNRV